MVLIIYKKIAPYLCLFLALTTIGFAANNVWQGKVIVDLQSQLLKDRDQQIKVVIEQQHTANQVSQEYEQRKADRQEAKVVVTHEIEKIVSVPMYSGLCFDPDGLHLLNDQIRAINSSREPETTMSEDTGAK